MTLAGRSPCTPNVTEPSPARRSMERPTAAVPEGDPMASAPSDPRVPADPNEPVDDSPTNSLTLASLLRLSVYWLGLVAVSAGIGVILQERIKVLVPDPTIQYTTSASSRPPASSSPSSSSRRSARSATTPSAASGGASRTSSSARCSTSCSSIGLATSNTLLVGRGVRRPAAVQLELRPGPVPGLRPGPRPGAPGRAGERHWSGCSASSASSSARAIGVDRPRDRRLHARRRSRSASSSSSTMLSLFFRLDEGRAREGPRRAGRGASIAAEAWGTDILARAQLRVPRRLALLHPRRQRVPDRARRCPTSSARWA